MKFNKGAELDKQIYEEGESTWGLKSGVLDVEDFKDFIKELKKTQWRTNNDIDSLCGDGLFVNLEDKSQQEKCGDSLTHQHRFGTHSEEGQVSKENDETTVDNNQNVNCKLNGSEQDGNK